MYPLTSVHKELECCLHDISGHGLLQEEPLLLDLLLGVLLHLPGAGQVVVKQRGHGGEGGEGAHAGVHSGEQGPGRAVLGTGAGEARCR